VTGRSSPSNHGSAVYLADLPGGLGISGLSRQQPFAGPRRRTGIRSCRAVPGLAEALEVADMRRVRRYRGGAALCLSGGELLANTVRAGGIDVGHEVTPQRETEWVSASMEPPTPYERARRHLAIAPGCPERCQDGLRNAPGVQVPRGRRELLQVSNWCNLAEDVCIS